LLGTCLKEGPQIVTRRGIRRRRDDRMRYQLTPLQDCDVDVPMGIIARATATLIHMLILTLCFYTSITNLDCPSAMAASTNDRYVAKFSLPGDATIVGPKIRGQIHMDYSKIMCINTVVDERFDYAMMQSEAIIQHSDAGLFDDIAYVMVKKYVKARDHGMIRKSDNLAYVVPRTGRGWNTYCSPGQNAIHFNQTIKRNSTDRGYDISINITDGINSIDFTVKRHKTNRLPIRRRPSAQVKDPVIDGIPYWDPQRDFKLMFDYLISNRLLG